MQEKQSRNQLISARPQGLNEEALPIDCIGGESYRAHWLIADHKQLTGRDTALSPAMTWQDNKDN